MSISRIWLVSLVALSFTWVGITCAGAQSDPDTTNEPGRLIFQDDFATFAGRWRMGDSPKGQVEIADQGLHVRVVSPGYSVWTLPDLDVPLENYVINCVASLSSETATDSRFGVVIGYEDEEHFTAVMLDAAGRWTISSRVGEQWTEMLPIMLDAEAPLEAKVEIEIQVVGDTITLVADGVGFETYNVQDQSLVGKFGLVAIAGHGVIDVVFDDVLVTELKVSR